MKEIVIMPNFFTEIKNVSRTFVNGIKIYALFC